MGGECLEVRLSNAAQCAVAFRKYARQLDQRREYHPHTVRLIQASEALAQLFETSANPPSSVCVKGLLKCLEVAFHLDDIPDPGAIAPDISN